MLNAAGDKSFVDDLAASGYCKCESSLCCYEALRFIPCFYDLFFFVFKISKRASMVCRIFARTGFGCEFAEALGDALLFTELFCQSAFRVWAHKNPVPYRTILVLRLVPDRTILGFVFFWT